MADVEASVEIEVEGAGSLRDAAEAARSLADALKEAEASAGSISGAFASAAEAASKLRDDAEEAAQALKSIRDAGLGVGDVAATLGGSSEAASKLRDDLGEAEDALASLVATGPGAADIAAFLEADESAAASLRTALQGVADAEAEVAAGGAGMGDGAAGLEAEAAAAGHLRDNLIEADAAQSGMAGHAGSIEKTAADMRGAIAMMEQGQTALVSKIGPEQFGQVITKDAEQLEILGGGLKNVKTNLDDLGDTAASRLDKLNLVQDFLSARSATDAYAESVKGAKESLEEAEPVFKDAEIESSGLRDAMKDLGNSPGMGFLGGATSGWKDLLSGAGDAKNAIGDVDKVAEDAAPSLLDLGSNAGALGEAFSSVGEAASGAMGPITSLALPTAIGGLVTTLIAAAPGLAAVGAGFVSFGALAFPALDKVKDGLSSVTSAQQAYELAVGVEKRDPTTSNLAAEQKALATLQTTWANMPRPVSAAVQAVQQFGHAFSEVSQKSGIQKDFLSDIPTAIHSVENALPSLVTLAKSAAPVISGMFSDLGKNFQSGGFQSFIHSLSSDIAPAARSFHNLAGAAGDFLSDLQKDAGGAGTQFINALSQLGKTNASGMAGSLASVVKSATQLIHLGNDVTNNPTVKTVFDLLGGMGAATTGQPLSASVNRGAAEANSGMLGGSGRVGAEMSAQQFAAQKAQAAAQGRQIAQAETQAWRHSMQAAGIQVPVPMKVKPEIKFDKADKAAMERQLTGNTLMGGGKVTVPGEAKVDKADTSGLKGGDTKVPATAQVDKVDTSGINKAASNVKIHGVTVDLADAKLSGLTALSSSLQSAGSSAGKSFDTGLASGISGGAGAATSAAQHVVTEIKASLSTLGAAGSAAGAALGAGLAAGIAASTGAAVAAATKMASEVTAAVKAAHATASPSKVFKGIGADDVKGLIQGLEGGKSELDAAAKDMAAGVTAPFKDTEITDTIKKLETDLKDSLKAGDISKTEDTGVSAWLSYDNKRLMNLASQRKNIEAAISGADALYKSVDSATVQGANVATFASNAASGGSASSDSLPGAPDALAQWQATGGVGSSIQSQLKQYLSQTRAFTSDVKKLKAEGLDQTSLTQLLQAGVSGGGLSGAQMLLSGGPKGVKEVASLQNQISQAAKQLGTTGANAAYESGSQIGGGLASGLKAELGSVTDAIKSLATSIVDEMQKGLSSGALENIGKDWASQIAKGMAGGGSGGGGGGSAHAAPILAAAGGGGGGTIHVHLNVGGTEIAQVVQTYTLQHARRNTGSGLQLRGRGT